MIKELIEIIRLLELIVMAIHFQYRQVSQLLMEMRNLITNDDGK